MQRVVIIGRGASGKSALAVELAEITGLPVIELDKIFWQSGLVATPRDKWMAIQQELVERDRWIMDGDLGPYDVVDVRLRAADTVIFLDFSLVRCAWRAIRRSRERADSWRWLIAYRRRSRLLLLKAVAAYAGKADFRVFRNPRVLERFVERLARGSSVVAGDTGAAPYLGRARWSRCRDQAGRTGYSGRHRGAPRQAHVKGPPPGECGPLPRVTAIHSSCVTSLRTEIIIVLL